MTCWACALAHGDPSQHLTAWFYVGPEGAVVEDLSPRAYDMRLLFVPVEHYACGLEPSRLRDEAVRLLRAVAAAVCQNRDMELVGLDLYRHSYRDHWHAQANLARKREGVPLLEAMGVRVMAGLEFAYD